MNIKMDFSIEDFLSKYEKISRKPLICSYLLKTLLMENLLFGL